jgi:hypothetical protein
MKTLLWGRCPEPAACLPAVQKPTSRQTRSLISRASTFAAGCGSTSASTSRTDGKVVELVFLYRVLGLVRRRLFCSAVVSFLLRNIAGALRRHFVFEVPIRRFLIRRFFPHFRGIVPALLRDGVAVLLLFRFAFAFPQFRRGLERLRRASIQRSISASSQARVCGASMKPGGKPSRLIQLSSAGQDRTMPRAFRSTNRTSLRGATLSIFGVSFTWSPQGLCATSREAHGLSVLRPVRNALSRGKGHTGFGRARA